MAVELKIYNNGLEMPEKRTDLSKIETAGLEVQYLALGHEGQSVKSTGDDSLVLTEVFVSQSPEYPWVTKSVYVRELVGDQISRANIRLETFTPGYSQRVSWHENGATNS